MRKYLTCILLGLSIGATSAWSTTTVVNPSIDGELRTSKFYPPVFLQGSYFPTAPQQQGIVRFLTPTLIEGDTATLTLYPAGLPLRGPTEFVYAYESSNLIVDASDVNAGAFIGKIDIPPSSDFGSIFTLDVTTFLKSASSPYVTFNLRSDGLNTFTGINGYSFQKPSQLVITSIPESGTFGLSILGLTLLALTLTLQRKSIAVSN